MATILDGWTPAEELRFAREATTEEETMERLLDFHVLLTLKRAAEAAEERGLCIHCGSKSNGRCYCLADD